MDLIGETNAMALYCALMEKWCPKRFNRADLKEFIFSTKSDSQYRELKNSAELHVALYRRAAVNMSEQGQS